MPEAQEFVALGHAGSGHYAGLETFPNPGVRRVGLTSDELTAMCPVTGQPDLYTATIEYRPGELCLESKSLKLYLMQFRNEGDFCEALAVRIRETWRRRFGSAADVTGDAAPEGPRRHHHRGDRLAPVQAALS